MNLFKSVTILFVIFHINKMVSNNAVGLIVLINVYVFPYAYWATNKINNHYTNMIYIFNYEYWCINAYNHLNFQVYIDAVGNFLCINYYFILFQLSGSFNDLYIPSIQCWVHVVREKVMKPTPLRKLYNFRIQNNNFKTMIF